MMGVIIINLQCFLGSSLRGPDGDTLGRKKKLLKTHFVCVTMLLLFFYHTQTLFPNKINKQLPMN